MINGGYHTLLVRGQTYKRCLVVLHTATELRLHAPNDQDLSHLILQPSISSDKLSLGNS